MGRPRKHPPLRFPTVVTDVRAPIEEARRRSEILAELAEPARGNAIRVDRLREALAIADRTSPRPPHTWRRGKGVKGSSRVVARREEHAATALIAMFADRGDVLTVANATRIIEQARELSDQAKGIMPLERKAIEEAREIVGAAHGAGLSFAMFTDRERAAADKAVQITERIAYPDARDREFLAWVRAIQRLPRCIKFSD